MQAGRVIDKVKGGVGGSVAVKAGGTDFRKRTVPFVRKMRDQAHF